MSLRARVLAGMAVVAVVLVGATILVARTTEQDLLDQVDAQLRAAERPVREASRGGPRPTAPPVSPDDDERPRQFSSLYVGVLSGDTVVPVASPNLDADDTPLPAVTAEQARDSVESGQPFTTGSDPSGLSYRALAREADNDVVVVVALPLDDVDAAVTRLVRLEVAVTAAILALLGLVTWWVVALGVRPVKKMTAAATAMARGDFSHRVPEADARTEAGELGAALNQMLDRIEEAFDERSRSEGRLRRFVADASHELRTPVTTIRGYAELYRDGGLADQAELDDAMRRTEQEATRMGNLVDDLLHLARLDQGRPLQRDPVVLDEIVDDAVRDARAVDPDRPITTDLEDDVVVIGDENRLRQVVANLIGNARVHTPPGTPISVRVAANGRVATIDVHDDGPGMDVEVAARAFERFFRGDPSRSRHHGGSGLGLSIVEATVGAHGGTVRIESARGAGTTVRVELPLAAAGAGGDSEAPEAQGGSEAPGS